MAGPIKPNEVVVQKTNQLPEEVFEAFNCFIAKNWDGNRSVVRQKEVLH